jgi:hypothetical protein
MTEEIRQLEYELDLEGLLPDHPQPGSGERRYQLTRHDLLALAAINRKTATAPCSIGLTPEQGILLKRMLRMIDRGLSAVGLLFLAAVFGVFWLIFQKGFWVWIKAAGNKG